MAKKARGAPSKTCTACGKKVHARTAKCPKCGLVFTKKVKEVKPSGPPVESVRPQPVQRKQRVVSQGQNGSVRDTLQKELALTRFQRDVLAERVDRLECLLATYDSA